MEKTLAIHLAEQREQIAIEIESMEEQPCSTCAMLKAAEIVRGNK